MTDGPGEVVAAALFRNGRLLLAQRTGPAELAGLWELPGGKVEPGETVEDALRRELREELGVDVSGGETVVLDRVEPWSAEVPRLYECVVAGAGERVVLPVGFRRVVVQDDLLLVSRKAQSIRFHADDDSLRPMGRATSGVIGMRFAADDVLLAMEVIPAGDDTTEILSTMLGLSPSEIDGLYAEGIVHRVEPFVAPQVAPANP